MSGLYHIMIGVSLPFFDGFNLVQIIDVNSLSRVKSGGFPVMTLDLD